MIDCIPDITFLARRWGLCPTTTISNCHDALFLFLMGHIYFCFCLPRLLILPLPFDAISSKILAARLRLDWSAAPNIYLPTYTTSRKRAAQRRLVATILSYHDQFLGRVVYLPLSGYLGLQIAINIWTVRHTTYYLGRCLQVTAFNVHAELRPRTMIGAGKQRSVAAIDG